MRLPGRLAISPPGLLLLALVIAHLAFSFLVNPPGYLTFDSGTYHYMARTLATTGSFIVWNGYEEFPSPALEVAQLRINDAGLVAQYPEFLTVLGYPFYVAFGYHGLLLLNAVAFVGINVLIFSLARLLFQSRRIGYLAMAVYTFATFAWEYSQSSYPHLSSALFVLGSYYLVALSVKRRAGGSWSKATLVLSAGAGLAAGLGVGLRLDAAFGIPGLFVPLLFAGRLMLAELAALVVGLAPGLLFLSIVNSIKFDTFSPFSYGAPGYGYIGGIDWYIPVSLLAALLVACLLTLRCLPAAQKRKALIVLAGCLMLACLLQPAAAGDFVGKLADGAYQIAIDLRIRDLDLKEPALTRTHGGAMVYMDGVKKSLLQSCPYLVMIPFILVEAVRNRKHLDALVFLCIVPASFLIYFSYLAWHGSIALNMRYLNPILPFTSILSAYVWSNVASKISPRSAGFFGGTLLGGLCLLFAITEPTLRQQEVLFLTTPLLIAVAIGIFEIIRRLGLMSSVSGAVVCYLLLTAFAWSGAVAFGRDYPTSTKLRRANLILADAIRPYIRDDSLIVSDLTDSCWKLIDEVRDLRIADPLEDNYRSFDALVRFHLDHGRTVYMAYSRVKFAELAISGRAQGFKFRMLDRWTVLGRPELMLFEVRAK